MRHLAASLLLALALPSFAQPTPAAASPEPARTHTGAAPTTVAQAYPDTGATNAPSASSAPAKHSRLTPAQRQQMERMKALREKHLAQHPGSQAQAAARAQMAERQKADRARAQAQIKAQGHQPRQNDSKADAP